MGYFPGYIREILQFLLVFPIIIGFFAENLIYVTYSVSAIPRENGISCIREGGLTARVGHTDSAPVADWAASSKSSSQHRRAFKTQNSKSKIRILLKLYMHSQHMLRIKPGLISNFAPKKI